ncbi:MAG: AarF/UbiB family protein [Polyangiales bacterium]
MPTWSLVVLAAVLLVAFLAATSRTVRRFFVTVTLLGQAALGTLWDGLRGKPDTGPGRLRHAFEQLGPTYVKLAQLVASSEGVFPEPYCVEFRKCLDRVPPFPIEDVKATLREEIHENLEGVFSVLEEKPLASASIAQVHGAVLPDGTRVVVKVQRPHLDDIIRADLRVLRFLARILEKIPFVHLTNPRSIVDDFAANLDEELDFRKEAANLDEFNALMEKHAFVGVAAPKPVHELSGRHALVMERFDGVRIDDPTNLELPPDEIEGKLLLGMRAWFRCLLVHGFFHGDVHAGNLMSLHDGRIGFLDFGIVGRFQGERRRLASDFLITTAARDFEGLARCMVTMSHMEGVDVPALAADLDKHLTPMLDPSKPVKYADLLPAVTKATLRHRLPLARDFVLILKQMIYFDRYAKLLAPNLNILADPRILSGLMEDLMLAQAANTAEAA